MRCNYTHAGIHSEVTQGLGRLAFGKTKQNKKAKAKNTNKKPKAKQYNLDQNKQDTCAMLSRK